MNGDFLVCPSLLSLNKAGSSSSHGLLSAFWKLSFEQDVRMHSAIGAREETASEAQLVDGEVKKPIPTNTHLVHDISTLILGE